uniref:Uncharacterized protein LOC100177538 n=1 Tax=Phallusia mammillata TaxID=59560 RepID=A0A6F9DH83_9ASCI|nr:uncharacterized protein LOC100177538 [Phallusia mammillata]
MNLVAGYSSSSEEEQEPIVKPKVVLPSASQVLDKIKQTSVLETQYERSKKQEDLILEQHVKMVETQQQSDQGKKICWMFKKGRCKFGNKCKHRHDRLSSELAEKKKPPQTVETPEDNDTSQKLKTKKRYGVSDNLVPPKKALKQIHSTYTNKHS